MLDEAGVYGLLDMRDISYTTVKHEPVSTVDKALAAGIPELGVFTKSLMLNNDKKKLYYLVCMPASKTIDLKELAEIIPSRRLSFSSEDALKTMLGVGLGCVTPIGLFNDEAEDVVGVFDKSLVGQTVCVHPLVNDVSLFVPFDDMIQLILDNGVTVLLRDL